MKDLLEKSGGIDRRDKTYRGKKVKTKEGELEKEARPATVLEMHGTTAGAAGLMFFTTE